MKGETKNGTRYPFALFLLLLVLAGLATWSSRQPDAVQRVLGLPGGVERPVRAIFGVATVACLTIGLMSLIKGYRSK